MREPPGVDTFHPGACCISDMCPRHIYSCVCARPALNLCPSVACPLPQDACSRWPGLTQTQERTTGKPTSHPGAARASARAANQECLSAPLWWLGASPVAPCMKVGLTLFVYRRSCRAALTKGSGGEASRLRRRGRLPLTYPSLVWRVRRSVRPLGLGPEQRKSRSNTL